MVENYFKKYLEERNISQYEVERKTGISQSKISLTLNGKRKLTANELVKIAIEFDIDLNVIKKSLSR